MDNQPYQRSIGIVEADIEDNCKVHGVRGILEHSDIEKMIAEYDEDDKQARIFGKFQHLTGLIYKKFNRVVHVIKPFDIKPQDFVTIEALDPHPRNPDALMWVAIDKYNRKLIVDEMYENFEDVAQLAYAIRAKADRFRVVKRIADPAAWNTDQHKKDNRSLYTDLYSLGLIYERASKARHQAILRTKSALNWIYQAGEYQKRPELYIFDTCIRTIWEFEHWQWQEWARSTANTRSPNEKPIDKDDHMMENIGRVLLEEIEFTEYKDEIRDYFEAQNPTQASEPVDDPY
jgi:hypothetical protein